MSNDEIEAVARAIRECRRYGRSSEDCATEAIAALRALGWQKVPEGSVVVPMEPTEKMFAAARHATSDYPHNTYWLSAYRSMLAARPDAGKGET